MRFTVPVAAKLNHIIVSIRKINAKASQPIKRNIARPLIGNINAANNGIVRGKDGVTQVCSNGAIVVIHVHHKSRHVILVAKCRRQSVERRLSLDGFVRLVLELADGMACSLPDLYGRFAEIAAANVREFTALATNEIYPALDGLDRL